MPAASVDEVAAHQRAEADAQAADRGPHDDRLSSLFSGKDVGDDRQGRRKDQGATHPLERPHGDQLPDCRRPRRPDHSCAEQDEPDGHRSLAAVAVAD